MSWIADEIYRTIMAKEEILKAEEKILARIDKIIHKWKRRFTFPKKDEYCQIRLKDLEELEKAIHQGGEKDE